MALELTTNERTVGRMDGPASADELRVFVSCYDLTEGTQESGEQCLKDCCIRKTVISSSCEFFIVLRAAVHSLSRHPSVLAVLDWMCSVYILIIAITLVE